MLLTASHHQTSATNTHCQNNKAECQFESQSCFLPRGRCRAPHVYTADDALRAEGHPVLAVPDKRAPARVRQCIAVGVGGHGRRSTAVLGYSQQAVGGVERRSRRICRGRVARGDAVSRGKIRLLGIFIVSFYCLK